MLTLAYFQRSLLKQRASLRKSATFKAVTTVHLRIAFRSNICFGASCSTGLTLTDDFNIFCFTKQGVCLNGKQFHSTFKLLWWSTLVEGIAKRTLKGIVHPKKKRLSLFSQVVPNPYDFLSFKELFNFSINEEWGFQASKMTEKHYKSNKGSPYDLF